MSSPRLDALRALVAGKAGDSTVEYPTFSELSPSGTTPRGSLVTRAAPYSYSEATFSEFPETIVDNIGKNPVLSGRPVLVDFIRMLLAEFDKPFSDDKAALLCLLMHLSKSATASADQLVDSIMEYCRLPPLVAAHHHLPTFVRGLGIEGLLDQASSTPRWHQTAETLLRRLWPAKPADAVAAAATKRRQVRWVALHDVFTVGFAGVDCTYLNVGYFALFAIKGGPGHPVAARLEGVLTCGHENLHSFLITDGSSDLSDLEIGFAFEQQLLNLPGAVKWLSECDTDPVSLETLLGAVVSGTEPSSFQPKELWNPAELSHTGLKRGRFPLPVAPSLVK
eukprot:TRINITY_DN2454_c0_g1_i1.p1 TRINITY_DN2454_c0_g1~~TRINITY_DN2454_c0_g1_i1.p1  ORF type:complete len:337 (-),score=26.47 TRINITY_DN2454_c0_g1_i1:181-1191(-)